MLRVNVFCHLVSRYLEQNDPRTEVERILLQTIIRGANIRVSGKSNVKNQSVTLLCQVSIIPLTMLHFSSEKRLNQQYRQFQNSLKFYIL